MSHPQEQELATQTRRMIDSGGERLTVHEPSGPHEVKIVPGADDSHDPPRAAILFRLPKDATAQRKAATKIGLPKPEVHKLQMRFGPMAGKLISLYNYTVGFDTPDEGARQCLRILHEVRGMPQDAWVWISDRDFDDWPKPLPKPTVWPPSA